MYIHIYPNFLFYGISLCEKVCVSAPACLFSALFCLILIGLYLV